MSSDGTIIGPPTVRTITAPSGVLWAITSPGGWVCYYDGSKWIQTNGHAKALKLDGADIWAQSPTGGIWWKCLGPKSWFNSGSAAEPGAPAQQFPLTAAKLSSLQSKLAAFQAEVSALAP